MFKIKRKCGAGRSPACVQAGAVECLGAHVFELITTTSTALNIVVGVCSFLEMSRSHPVLLLPYIYINQPIYLHCSRVGQLLLAGRKYFAAAPAVFALCTHVYIISDQPYVCSTKITPKFLV